MLKKPFFFLEIKIAASIAPLTNIDLLLALWIRSTLSLLPIKLTVCSPAISPPRVTEKPIFPFFLAPEMVLLIWGTTIFLPEFENLFDIKILLELSEKTAAARMFGIDDRQNFDQKFVDAYSKKEGKFYSNYLIENNVIEKIDYRIDFNNFYAFRFLDKI